MGYCDYTDEWVRGLTRQRRAEAQERRAAARRAHEGLTFPAVPSQVQQEAEAAWQAREVFDAGAPHLVWKSRQWAAGIRKCGYCGVNMTRRPNVSGTCTVDHRKPRAFGGLDEPCNWLLACLRCNNLKGTMSEASFRALIALERSRLTA